VHFEFAAPDSLDYAVNRYRREAERHYRVLDSRLAGRDYIVDVRLHDRRRVDHANRIALVDEIIEAFGQELPLLTIRLFNEAPHQFPRRITRES
jgi:glutathione S-transferase